MVADVFALFFPDFSKLICVSAALGIIQHIKGYGMPLALCLCHDAVFLFCFHLDARIVLRDPPQHICTLADIDDFIVDLDAVYPRVFILRRKPFAFEPVICVFLISSHQNSNTAFSIGLGRFFPSAIGRGMTISFTFGFWITPTFSSILLFVPSLFGVFVILFISIFSGDIGCPPQPTCVSQRGLSSKLNPSAVISFWVCVAVCGTS